MLAPLLVLCLADWLLRGREPSASGVEPHLASLAEDCTGAELVLLGNSKTRSDLNPRELEAFLGLPRGAVASLTLHGSSAPVWYAVLENLVYGRGCSPRQVVVYGTIDKLLAGDVSPDEQVRLLAPVLGDHEPVLTAKLGGGAVGGPWLQARQQAARRREALLSSTAALAVGSFYANPEGRGAASHGRELLDEAWGRVFAGTSAIQESERQAVLPVQGPVVPSEARQPKTADDTFVGELTQLASAHGSSLVLAWAPLEDAAEERATLAVPDLVEGSRAKALEAGASFLDLREPALPPQAWVDGRHMSAMGSTRNTWALARGLAALDPAVEGDAAPARATALWLLEQPRSFVSAPPELVLGPPRPEPSGAASASVTPPLPIGDQHCLEHEVWKCCSPLRVWEDERPLPEPNVAPQLVESLGGGRYTHLGERVLLSSSDGAAPGEHRYRAALDPERWCGSLWLYPGDEAQLGIGPASQALGALEVLARAFGTEAWTLRLELRIAGAEPQVFELELTPGEDRFLSMPFRKPTGAEVGPAELVLHSLTPTGYALVSHLALVPR